MRPPTWEIEFFSVPGPSPFLIVRIGTERREDGHDMKSGVVPEGHAAWLQWLYLPARSGALGVGHFSALPTHSALRVDTCLAS